MNMFELTLMQFNSIISALPKQWKVLLKEKISLDTAVTKYDTYSKCVKPSAKAYKEINASNMPFLTAHCKWIRKNYNVSFDDFCELFGNLYKCTNNAKLRSFQYRLLHSAVITNVQLKKWKIKQSSNCSLCNSVEETIIHLMFQCPVVLAIWRGYVTDKLRSITDEPFDLNEKTVMENRIHPNPAHVFNFVCLVTKMYIYSSKCVQKKLTSMALDAQIERYKSYELYEAKKSNKLFLHCKKWFIPEKYNGTGLEEEIIQEYTDMIDN